MAVYEFIEFGNAGDFLITELDEDETVSYITLDDEEETVTPLISILSCTENMGVDYEEVQDHLDISDVKMDEVIDYIFEGENLHDLARKRHKQRNYEPSEWVKSMSEDIIREIELTDEEDGKIELGIDSPESSIRRAYLNIIEKNNLDNPNINYEPSFSLVKGDEIHLEEETGTILAAGYAQDEDRFYLTADDPDLPELRVNGREKKELIDRVNEFYNAIN